MAYRWLAGVTSGSVVKHSKYNSYKGGIECQPVCSEMKTLYIHVVIIIPFFDAILR